MTEFTTSAKALADCSDPEIATFKAMVLRGGEVRADTLPANMERAQRLLFCKVGDVIVGVAAIKHPLKSYRASTASKAKIALPENEYPVEFGWCFVNDEWRGKGVSYRLVECAVQQIISGIFATSRVGNEGMHKALKKYGFMQEGDCYPSNQQAAWIVVFRRPKS